MQIKTTMKYHLTSVRMARVAIIKKTEITSVGEDVEKGTIVHCWWECKFGQPLWKKVLGLLKKLKIELSYDPVIPLLDIYPKEIESVSWRDICILMFVAALFTITKIWKQPQYQSIDRWMDKENVIHTHTHTHTHTEILFSHKKRNRAICINMDEPEGH